MKITCPICNGTSGSSDYFGEWAECACCNPWNCSNETGRVWIWQYWLFLFKQWRIDRQIMREMKRDVAGS